ncbi:MAG TPA: hypothetical protein VFS19_00955 [Planctomycetota bacterium]|nr:hypothetical protein [Planctomycetota bacterium]
MSEWESQLETKPDRFERWLFGISLVALFLAVFIWLVLFTRSYKVIFDQLGMTELPWITELALAIGNGATIVMLILALGLLVFGFLAWRRATPKTLNRMTAINFIIAALMPGYVYLAVHMPIVELQKKLGGGS